MPVKFRALSLSHKNAPVQIREIISLDDQAVHLILLKIKDFFSLNNALVLSTCNRTEVYYTHDRDISTEIIKLIGLEKGLTDIVNYLEYFEIFNDDRSAIRHLFRVSMGLEAQVVGDIQISNQIKRAYQTSADLNMTGPFLHRLMHTVFFTNKRIVQETAFRDGAASLSYAAIELIESLTSNTFEPRILLIGLGEIGEDVAKNMVHLPTAKVKITNRTISKAESVAAVMGFEVVPFENCFEAMEEADVIVCSILRSEPFITKELVKKFQINSYKLLVDLSVPRSIETSVEDVPGIVLYNVDNIRSKASETLEKRLASVPKVEEIIEESIKEFFDWKKEMIASPTINKLKQSLEQIRKVPVVQLRAACQRDQAEEMIQIISDLFDLEKVKTE